MPQQLTLADAIGGYQDGVAWRQQQDEYGLQKAARQRGLDADAAAAAAYRRSAGLDDAAPAAPGLGAAAAPQTPTAGLADASPPMGDASAPRMPAAPDGAAPAGLAAAAPAAPKAAPDKAKAILAAYEARGNSFAKAGDWHGFMQNEANIAPLRVQIRARAMQQYGVDKDPAKLAKAVYPTIFDGKEITDAQIVPGGDPNAPKGAPAGPAKMRVTLSDGTTNLVDPDAFVQKVNDSLVDPVAFAQKQAEFHLWQAKNNIEQQGKVALEGVKAGHEKEKVTQQGENALAVADKHAGATLGAANIHAGATRYAADVGADSRESVAHTRTTNADGSPKVQKVFTDSEGYATATFKDGTTKRLQIDGKPIKANDYSKRVDGLVNQMRKTSSGFGKSEQELRSAAEQSLAGGGQAAPTPTPGAKDFSNLWN